MRDAVGTGESQEPSLPIHRQFEVHLWLSLSCVLLSVLSHLLFILFFQSHFIVVLVFNCFVPCFSSF